MSIKSKKCFLLRKEWSYIHILILIQCNWDHSLTNADISTRQICLPSIHIFTFVPSTTNFIMCSNPISYYYENQVNQEKQTVQTAIHKNFNINIIFYCSFRIVIMLTIGSLLIKMLTIYLNSTFFLIKYYVIWHINTCIVGYVKCV